MDDSLDQELSAIDTCLGGGNDTDRGNVIRVQQAIGVFDDACHIYSRFWCELHEKSYSIRTISTTISITTFIINPALYTFDAFVPLSLSAPPHLASPVRFD